MVIIVLALVGILATVALWISLTNFQMKITDRNVTDSFYSAEGVLDQICAGLQGDASEVLDGAYNTVMQKYASLSEAERSTTFANTYVFELRSRLSYTDASVTAMNGAALQPDMLYDLGKIKGYVSAELMDAGNVDIYFQGDGVTYANSDKYGILNTTAGGIVLKNLVVEYTDDEGYLSIIQTDIVMGIPDMNLVSSENVPKVFGYSIIGNEGVCINGYQTAINGSVYSGSLYALNEVQTGTDAEYYKSLVVADTATVDFSNADYVIADGNIVIGGSIGSTLKFATNPYGELWGRNLMISGSEAGLYGTTYICDDMTLSGTGPKVSFSTSENGLVSTYGSYVGYGTSKTDASLSSAIIINGTDAVLDLSGVETMVIGGYAYIGTNRISTSGGTAGIANDSNILLGESVSVKGDQIAYLLPSECIGTVGGTSAFFQNPLSVGDYKKIMNDPQTYTLVDADVRINRTGKELSDYLGDKTVSEAYTKIVVPSKTGNPDDGLVYFYLNLEPEGATRYFLDYYNADSSKLASYTEFYTDGIQAVGENAQIYTAGTYVEYESGDLDSLVYGIGTDPVNGVMANLPDRYEALTTKLISDYSALTAEEIGNTVFDNIIQVNETAAGQGDGLKEFLASCPGREYTVSVVTAEGKNFTAVLIDNEGMSVYDPSLDPYISYSGDDAFLIIATGDVAITSNTYNGTIIAGGTVAVGNAGSANITMDTTSTENVKKLLAQECDNGSVTLKLYEFFKDGNVYISNGFGSGDSEDTLSKNSTAVELSDLIGYQNWKKK